MKRWQYHFAALGLLTATGVYVRPIYAQAQTYTVTISDRSFTPNMLTARSDHSVRITIINNGTKVHNFILPAFYIYTPNIAAKHSTWVEFTPDKKGKFPFYSDADGDKKAGLEGSIEVH